LIALLLFLPLSNYAVTGFPGINLSISAHHESATTKDNQVDTTTSSKSSNITFGLGATLNGGMYLGSIYDVAIKNEGNNNFQDSNLGFSVGFTDRGAYMTYHHFFNSVYYLDSNTKYLGDGYGFDLGFQMILGEGFSIGGQFSYKKTNLNNKIVNGETTPADYGRETIYPSVILGFSF
tara:strand:+ start:10703 stop:11236 length:534 start_codon:yes stop_codon:yes gene_type:complete